MTDNCQWLITPGDCHTTPTTPTTPDTAPAGPDGADAGMVFDPFAVHPEAPPGTPEPVRQVTDPVVAHVDGWHLPDISQAAHVAGTSLVCGLVVVAMLVMIVGVAAGWPLSPHRLRNFAIGALMLPVLSAVAGGSWSTPLSLFWTGACEVAAGDLAGLRLMLTLGVPVAALAGTYCWAKFVLKTNTVGLKSLGRTERVQDALAVKQFRAAARAAKLGAPHSAGSSIVLGTLADRATARPAGLWRELTTRHEQWLAVPHRDAKRHQLLFGTTGSGKTETIKKYGIGLFCYEYLAWQRWKDVPGMAVKHPKPQLVLITCKGGEDDRNLGLEMLAAMLALGIPREEIGFVVPGGDKLDIWSGMPARDLRAIVEELLSGGAEATTSEGEHFDGMRARIAALVVDAPIGPPRSSAEFLERLHPDKLKDIWGNAPDVVRQVDAMQEEKVPQIDDALIKCSNLFDQLKDHDGQVVFDGGKRIGELSMLFMTVPALDKDAARAQVGATLRMVMQHAGRTARDERRSVTVFLDEASALTTKKGSIGLEDITERGRSQGVALIFSGQSPESIAPDQWSLNRLLKACAGGVLLGYCENVGELCKHFGSVRSMLPSRHLIKGQRHGDEGQVSVGEKWLVDPDRVRRFDTGEFVYAKAGRAWFGHVVPLDTSKLSPLPGTPAAAQATTRTQVAGDAAATA
ncbi:hypothetical protein [Nocardia wallacei]|uniref:TraD/TraG TraM recognition site domain-containing protein n=1 Tax=Nocardia wallacei TaxID=480035 RepID=A0A7G1KQI1_9NOCA|nr:hypothetical protein [Nocardia wallacei]BCK57400.1 hypothetical protein NWFMUON74_51720 [Nocardia wallacei]